MMEALYSRSKEGWSWIAGKFDVQALVMMGVLGTIIFALVYHPPLATRLNDWLWTCTRGKPKPHGRRPSDIEPLDGFDWRAEKPTQFRPFKPIYHITMAIKNDTPSELITVDRDYLERIKLRKFLIAKHGKTVHGYVPGGEDAVRELYTYLLDDYLPARLPTVFSKSADGTLHNRATGTAFPRDAPSSDFDGALRVLGETVEEDIFLLQEMPGGHRSVAFVCCFPAGFDPSTKLGKTLKEIHKPVPSFERIGPSMERFFAKLKVGAPVKRVNWSVQTHSDLFAPIGNHMTEKDQVKSDEQINIDETFLRIELQTLTRLPKTQAILFSFKTYLYPLKEIKAEGSGPELADAIEGLQKGNAPGMYTYKSAVRWGKPVAEYLRS